MQTIFRMYLKYDEGSNKYFYITKEKANLYFKRYIGNSTNITEESRELEKFAITEKIYKKFKKEFLTRLGYFDNVEDTNIDESSEWIIEFVDEKTVKVDNHNLPLYVHTMLDFVKAYFEDLNLAGELDNIKAEFEIETEQLISSYLYSSKGNSEFSYIVREGDDYFICTASNKDGKYIEVKDSSLNKKRISEEDYQKLYESLKENTNNWINRYGDYDEGEDQWSIKFDDKSYSGYEEYPDNFKEVFNMLVTGEVIEVKVNLSELYVDRLKLIKTIMEFEDGTSNDLEQYIKDNKELINITNKIIDNMKK